MSVLKNLTFLIFSIRFDSMGLDFDVEVSGLFSTILAPEFCGARSSGSGPGVSGNPWGPDGPGSPGGPGYDQY